MQENYPAGQLPPFRSPDQPALEAALNRLVKAINSIKAMEVVGGGDIVVNSEAGRYIVSRIPDATRDESIRFRLSWDSATNSVFVGKGHVAFLPCCCDKDSDSSGIGSMEAPPIITPIEPTINGSPLWSVPYSNDGQPPSIQLDELGVHYIILKGTYQSAEIITEKEERLHDLDDLGEFGFYFLLGTVELTEGEGNDQDSKQYDSTIVQMWESDVVLGEVAPQESSSGSSSVSSSSSSSASSSSSVPSSSSALSSSGSNPSSEVSSEVESSAPSSTLPPDSSVYDSSGGPKSTAIVPASWTRDNYTALFIAEMPEVRFDDVMVVSMAKVTKRKFRVPIDSRLLEVCEPNSLQVCGYVCDIPISVGLKAIGGWLYVELPLFTLRKPETITARLSGIRKGFAGVRFPNRNAEQFQANERFINSAYPSNK